MTKLKSTLALSLVSVLALGQANAGWFDWLFPPSTYTKTKYPIVMIGGFMAFDDILGIDYFYGIPSELRSEGATVYPVNLSAFNSTEARGLQLEKQLEKLQALHGHKKFNIIGHSGGATTARFTAALRPDLVASVTSVHGSNHGVQFADWVEDVRQDLESGNAVGQGTVDMLANLVNTFGKAVEILAGHGKEKLPQDAIAMLEDYTTAKTAQFNKDYPQAVPATYCGEGQHVVNNVRYYSWGGTSLMTNPLDLLDYFFVLSGSKLFYTEANDGLVGKCSSHLGKVIRDDYNMNHVDAMNHLFGLTGLFSPSPKSLYRAQANRLKNAGL